MIENLRVDLKNITSVRDSKVINNLELTINLLEETWKREKNYFQEQIIDLKKKVITKLEIKIETKSYAMILKEKTVPIEEPTFAVMITGEGKETSEDIWNMVHLLHGA